MQDLRLPSDDEIHALIERLRTSHSESSQRTELIRAVETRSQERSDEYLVGESDELRAAWRELTSPYFSYYLNTWSLKDFPGSAECGFMSPEPGDQGAQQQQLVSFNKKTILSVAMDLGVADVEALSTLLLATMYGGIYSVVLDTAVDHKLDPNRTLPHQLYLFHLLRSQYLRHLEMLGVGSDVWLKNDRRTYSALINEELYHVDRIHEYEGLWQVTDKCAPLKDVSYGVLMLAGRGDLRDSLEGAIDGATAGMLLTDDLFDWQDDFELGRITYPLQLACRALGIGSVDEARSRKDDILRELYFGLTYHRIVETIVDRFYQSSRVLEKISPTAAAYIADNLDRVWRSWRIHTDAIRQAVGG